MEKCCGCDCKNCILYKPEKTYPDVTELGKHNVIDTTVYRKFQLKHLKTYQIDVLLYTFEYRYKNDVSNKDYTLNIPSGFFIKMRCPKEYKQENINSIYQTFRLTLCTEENILKTKRRDTATKPSHYEEDDYIIRPYTPTNIDEKQLTFQLLIKLKPGGAMTGYLQTLHIGDCVEVIGPFGAFKYVTNQYKNIVGISQGIGLTSIFAVMNSILKNKDDESRLTLYSCFIDLDNIFLRDEIYNFRKYWNFKSVIFVPREQPSKLCDDYSKGGKLKYNEIARNDYLTFDIIKQLFKEGKFKQKSTLVLISGSEAFINEIKNCIKNLNYTNFYNF